MLTIFEGFYTIFVVHRVFYIGFVIFPYLKKPKRSFTFSHLPHGVYANPLSEGCRNLDVVDSLGGIMMRCGGNSMWGILAGCAMRFSPS